MQNFFDASILSKKDVVNLELMQFARKVSTRQEDCLMWTKIIRNQTRMTYVVIASMHYQKLNVWSHFKFFNLNSTWSECNWTRTQNHLVLKRTLSLAKWLSVRLRTEWFWVWVQLQSLHLQISCLLRARSSLTFRQL